MADAPKLHLFCGKIGAGKSTLAASLAEPPDAVLIVEDAWLGALYADQMTTGADYSRCSEKLQGVMAPHVASLLAAGVTVVLDFPANTVAQRAWLRDLVATIPVPHLLHVLDVPDAVCLDRLQQRNASGQHPFHVTEAQFHRFKAHFAPPTADEGFTVSTVQAV